MGTVTNFLLGLGIGIFVGFVVTIWRWDPQTDMYYDRLKLTYATEAGQARKIIFGLEEEIEKLEIEKKHLEDDIEELRSLNNSLAWQLRTPSVNY